MGKNMRHQDSSSMPLQNGNPGCMNKILHALNRRQRWQNVRKVLPNKRQGSGKHIIDGEPSADTGQPPKVHHDPNMNKHKGTEVSPIASKSSKKSRIRSLISDEMAKRRGKHHWRRSSSPTHSPKKKTNSKNQIKNDPESWENDKLSTNSSESNCQSPSTIKKKRKCDICAAMLTVSYLRQNGLANEHQIEENIKEKEEQDSLEMLQVSDGHDTHNLHSHTPLHSRIGLTKSFSFPMIRSMKIKDYELKELKNKLKDCKDIQTIKEKFILAMNQWNDTGFLKPMLTRPASFKSPCPTSQMEKKKTTNNSKSVKQKFGFAIKDNRKEKRRILMDAVFHKIPYGRRSSKNPKKVSLEKLKSNSTSSNRIDQSSIGEKTHLKKTSSTSEAMSKYRRLLSQTSTRDEKLHLSDHKPRLFVAGEHSYGSSERKTHKRIRSLPDIGPYDFTCNQEFPDKPNMDIHHSIASELFDEQMSSDHFVERRNVYTATTESIRKGTKLADKDEAIDKKIGMGHDTFDLQEKNDHQPESSGAIEHAIKETELVDKDEVVDYQENNDHQNKSCADVGTTDKEDNLVNKDEVGDENLGVGLNTSNHQEKTDHQNEPRVVIEVEQDKNFNEILGMFQKVSDERKKLNNTTESTGALRKVTKNTTVENDHNVHKNPEVGQNTFNHHEKDMSQLTSSSEVDKYQDVHKNLEVSYKTLDQEKDNPPLTSESKLEMSIQESVLDSSSLVNISKSPLKSFSDENQQYMLSDDKRPNNPNLLDTSVVEYHMVENGFSNLDLESLKNNVEFQFVKEVLERSGFLENELLGEWYSSYQPIDPLLFEELETTLLQTKNLEELDSIKDEETAQKIINDHHLLLFDLINDALLELHNKTFTYCPHPLNYCSKIRPMPIGNCVLEQVWDIVTMYLSWKPVLQPSLDDVVSLDLAKGHSWMNLQADAEFVGIELEEMIVDDLLDELVFDDLLM